MEKKEKRIKSYFTITERVNEEFEKFTKEKFINKSRLIEGLIIDYLLKNNK